MNLLIERMENPGKRYKNALYLDGPRSRSLLENKRIISQKNKESISKLPFRINSTNDLSSKPLITSNDKPLEKGRLIKSESQRNLTLMFRNDLLHHSNSDRSLGLPELDKPIVSSFSKEEEAEKERNGTMEIRVKHLLRKKDKEDIYKRLQVYSSASTGRFSDIQFDAETPLNGSTLNHNCQKNNKKNHLVNKYLDTSEFSLTKNAKKLSTYSINESSNSVIMRRCTKSLNSSFFHGRRSLQNSRFLNDSNKAQTQRLVDQFLHSSKSSDFPSSFSSSSTMSLIQSNNLESSTYLTDYSNMSFQNLLYQDLDQPRMKSSFMLPTENSSGSSTSLLKQIITNEKSVESIPSNIVFQNDVATYDYTTLSSITQSKNKMLSLNNNDNKEEKDGYNKEDFNNSEEKLATYMRTLKDQSKNPSQIDSYKKHISTVLTIFENVMKETLQQVIHADEMKLFQTVNQFDELATDLVEAKQQLLDLQELIGGYSLNVLNSSFNEKEEGSFLYKLQQNVGVFLKDLQNLESKMENYKSRLSQQRERIKKLEKLAKLDNSLIKVKHNTRSVYQYRYIAIDLIIALIFIYVIVILKNVVL